MSYTVRLTLYTPYTSYALRRMRMLRLHLRLVTRFSFLSTVTYPPPTVAQPPYDVAGVVGLSRSLDPKRPVDTDSGGKANDLHIGDVNDIHTYP